MPDQLLVIHRCITHRDLKPPNVLVDHYDNKPVAKVIDFGVAKSLHQPLTRSKQLTSIATQAETAADANRSN